ncbi:MAG: SPOR domain-containing protein, partial [Proteobacteria bacterium]|nr:SPOR domain-containing protein [Pseudomonadota bacterium]
LKRDPFAPEPDAKFYYPFESFKQRLQVLNHLVQGTDLLVLVLGESGSGKTSLLHRYLVTTDENWKADRMQTDSTSTSDKSTPVKKSGSYPVFIQQDAKDPIVIVDDAHKLPEKDLGFLLQEALVPESSRKIKRLVLFGEPGLSNYITALSESTASDTAINKITMPALNGAEVGSYLQYRSSLAGHTGESLFKPSVVKMIHKNSAGLPGRINERADQWLKKKYSNKSQSEGVFTLLRNLPLKALGWGVAGIAAVILGLFVFNQMNSTPRTSPEKQKASLRVFRNKIPAVVDSDTPQFVNHVTPKAQETTPRKTAETKEQPTTLAKVPPQQVKQPQVKPPPLKPAMEKKSVAKNTIYRESWLLDQDSSFYTLQVLGVRNEESLLNFIKVHKLLKNQNMAYYKTVYRGKQWYPLLYGVYPTKSEAAEAVKKLPHKVQKSIPWIRKISAVQKEVQRETKR